MNAVRKQWAGEYLKQAFDDEIELAALHPKFLRRVTAPSVLTLVTDLYADPPKGVLSARYARTTPTMPLPRWRRAWSAAGPLSTELGLSIRHDQEEGTVSVGTGNRRRDVTEAYADHPDNDAATMAAIVRAAIQLCAEAREQ